MECEKEFKSARTRRLLDENLRFILVPTRGPDFSKRHFVLMDLKSVSVNQNTNMGNSSLGIGNYETIEYKQDMVISITRNSVGEIPTKNR